MAVLRVHPDRLEVRLSRAEKALAFRSDDIIVPREQIRSATITDDPWVWIRGIRSRGTMVPLVVATGVWKYHGGKDFVALKGRRQAVVLGISGGDFARLIVTTGHAGQLIHSLELLGDVPSPADQVTGDTEDGSQPE